MDKAIIGAAVALLIFIFTQILIHLRDRQAFLREKLENLFDALNELSSCLMDTYYGAQTFEESGNVDELNKQMKAIDLALYRPRSLFLLYFYYLTKSWEELIVHSIIEYVDFCNNSTENKEMFSSEKCKKHIDALSLKIRYFQNFLAKNTAFSTESIGFHFNRIVFRRVKIIV